MGCRIEGNVKILPTRSIELIKSMKGHSILKMFKTLESAKEKMLETFKIDESQLFELAYGKLFIELDNGRLFCLFRNLKRISVTIELVNKEEVLKQISTSEVIDHSDDKYSNKQWGAIIGQQIKSVDILKYHDEYNNMGINERGIQFNLESDEFIFSQTLRAKGPGATIVMKRSDVGKEFVDKLEIIRV